MATTDMIREKIEKQQAICLIGSVERCEKFSYLDDLNHCVVSEFSRHVGIGILRFLMKSYCLWKEAMVRLRKTDLTLYTLGLINKTI